MAEATKISIKDAFLDIAKAEILVNIIPEGYAARELSNLIDAGNYEKALFKLIVLFIRDLNEKTAIDASARAIYLDKLLDLLEKLMAEQKDIKALVKEYIEILERYLRVLRSQAIHEKNEKMQDLVENQATSLRYYLVNPW
jgi:hypothetical protein